MPHLGAGRGVAGRTVDCLGNVELVGEAERSDRVSPGPAWAVVRLA